MQHDNFSSKQATHFNRKKKLFVSLKILIFQSTLIKFIEIFLLFRKFNRIFFYYPLQTRRVKFRFKQ